LEKPFAGFICSSLDIFEALSRAEIKISPPGFLGGVSEVFPGHIWKILGGGDLPKKGTRKGRQARKRILEALGVSGLPAVPTHDQNDACVAALLAASADRAVRGITPVGIGSPLFSDSDGTLREGMMVIPKVSPGIRTLISGVLPETSVVGKTKSGTGGRRREAGANLKTSTSIPRALPRTPIVNTIKFGTDGWRGVIGDDFTFANVRHVAAAIAHYICEESEPERGLIVGYDTRFLSADSGQAVAEVLSAAGIRVWLADAATPTPAVSYAVVARQTAGAVLITASHNPYRWNGVKFKAPYGGSAAPAIIHRIETHLRLLDRVRPRRSRSKPASVETVDLITPYLDRLKSSVRLDRIRSSRQRFVIDPMYGAARGCIARLFDEAGIACREIHSEHNPLFPGLNPEPIEPHVAELRQVVEEGGYDAGFATDGDADRIGAMDRSGLFIDSHKIFSILLQHLAGDMGLRGEVVKTFSTTQMIDKLARRYDLPVHVTPIGFKYICELMLTRDVLIGGEESGGIATRGHLPERDGILNSLLLAEVMAEKGKTLGELVEDLSREFGPHFYDRVDLEVELSAAQRLVKQVARGKFRKVAGLRVTAIEDMDGAKLRFGDSAWLLVRASGTENILRLYAEAPSHEQVKALLDEMTSFATEPR
jgi:phosphomannomutase